MGRLIRAIRRKLRRGRKNRSRPGNYCSDHASLKSKVNELGEQLNRLSSRQRELTEQLSDMTEQLKGIVNDATEGSNIADKIADMVKEVRKDTPLGENDDSERSDGTIYEDALSCPDCSGDSEEELSCSSGSELSCSGDSGEELSCSEESDEESWYQCSGDSEDELSDSDEECSCSGDSEDECSCSGDSEEDLSCSSDSEDELSEGVHSSTGLERQCSEEDSFQIPPYQSSSEESVQKIDAAEAEERKQLWEQQRKAYYDRMLRERPELFYPAYYTAPQHFSPQQASSYSSVQHQVSSQQCYASGTGNVASYGCYHSGYYAQEQDQFYVPDDNKGTASDHVQLHNTTQFSFGTNSNRVLAEQCEHDTSELQPSIGGMGETVYPEYNMWSVQRIAE